MKARLLAGAVTIAQPGDYAPPPAETPAKGKKPVATIGTMQRDTTPDQRKLHGQMKRDMKRAARNIRYDQHLREQEARDKP